jgi:hypothetical protein
VYDTCIEVALDGPHLARLGGFTSVNVKTADDGFDGSVWEDDALPVQPEFIGLDQYGQLPLGIEVLKIGPGFRFTISEGRCYLDARAPAHHYSAEDIMAAVDWVGALETQLNAAMADPYADAEALPLNMLLHLAKQDWDRGKGTMAALEAVRDRVVSGPVQGGRYAALVWLLFKANHWKTKTEDLRAIFERDDMSEAEYRIVFRRGDPSEEMLLEVLAGMPADRPYGTDGERAILQHLSAHGSAQVAQILGAKLVAMEAAQATRERLDIYRAARAKIAARAGGEHVGVLSMVEIKGAAGGVALAEEDGLDRARKRVQELGGRADAVFGDEKDRE